MKRLFFIVLTAVGLVILSAMVASCNVTRRVTVESAYVTKGDTCTVITTKTVEQYDAKRNNTIGY